MEFREYVRVLRSRRTVVLTAIAMFVAAAVVAGALRPPVYTAEARLLMEQPSAVSAMLGMQSQQSFQPDRDMSTHAELVRSPEVAAAVIERLQLAETPVSLLERIEVEPIGQSDLLAIRAEAPGPGRASSLANAFAAAYTEQRAEEAGHAVARMQETLNGQRSTVSARLADAEAGSPQHEAAAAALAAVDQQLETLGTADALDLAGMRVAVAASADRATGGGGLLRNGIIGLSLGLVFGIGAAFAAEHFDTRVRSAAHVRRAGLSVVGALPTDKRARGAQPIALLRDPAGQVADAYRLLGRALESSRGNTAAGPSTLIVAAPSGSSDSAITAANLSLALAHSGRATVLIDCDMRRTPVQSLLGLPGSSGLAELLAGARKLAEVTHHPMPLLSVVAAGATPTSPADALGSARMGQVVGEAARSAEWVVLNAPGLLDSADTVALLGGADSMLLVLKSGESTEAQLEGSVELLARFGPRVRVGAALIGASGDGRGATAVSVGALQGLEPTMRPVVVPGGGAGEVLAQ